MLVYLFWKLRVPSPPTLKSEKLPVVPVESPALRTYRKRPPDLSVSMIGFVPPEGYGEPTVPVRFPV
jgi:hypothetical protein